MSKKNIFIRSFERLIDFFHIFSFIFLIFLYFISIFAGRISKIIKIFRPIYLFVRKIAYKIGGGKKGSMSSIDIINLAYRNMSSKRNRTVVTIGGITLGISLIVLLVSIGYGVQELVIDKVTTLDEMRQTEVSVLPGSNLFLTDEVADNIKSIPNVQKVLPQIAVVGKVNYNNSMFDFAVYGVTDEYLKESAISPFIGKIFEVDNDNTYSIAIEKEITYQNETEVVEDNSILNENWIELEGESYQDESLKIVKLNFPQDIPNNEVVINRSSLMLLGISEEDVIGKEISVSFISTSKSLLSGQSKIESSPVKYKIVGVTPDDITPLIYVPFYHLTSMGIESYSQVKVVTDSDTDLQKVRNAIEALGYSTSSVADTVSQINNLFSTLRKLLAIFGSIALLVAALGMFNTLTVSLLERTREIGLLKAMGMKSREVRDLFLAESMIMGVTGGLLGIVVGLMIGKGVEVGLSLYAVSKGVGTISIIDLPLSFILFVILLSFIVGFLTGLYPARRATKISALNALRYE